MESSYLVVLNAADEEAVNLYLNGIITFDFIPCIIEQALQNHRPVKIESVQDIMEVDRGVRLQVKDFIKSSARKEK